MLRRRGGSASPSHQNVDRWRDIDVRHSSGRTLAAQGSCADADVLLPWTIRGNQGGNLPLLSLLRRWAAAVGLCAALLTAQRPATAADFTRIETIVVLYPE